jgi:hypothetical protein
VKRRRGLAVLLAAPTLGLVAVGVVLAGVRIGCPSQEELGRPRDAGEVVEAFADAGVPLERVAPPAALREDPAYRRAATCYVN